MEIYWERNKKVLSSCELDGYRRCYVSDSNRSEEERYSELNRVPLKFISTLHLRMCPFWEVKSLQKLRTLRGNHPRCRVGSDASDWSPHKEKSTQRGQEGEAPWRQKQRRGRAAARRGREGSWEPLDARRSEELVVPYSFRGKHSPAVTLILDLASGTVENKFCLFSTIMFVLICYSSLRKLIQKGRKNNICWKSLIYQASSRYYVIYCIFQQLYVSRVIYPYFMVRKIRLSKVK